MSKGISEYASFFHEFKLQPTMYLCLRMLWRFTILFGFHHIAWLHVKKLTPTLAIQLPQNMTRLRSNFA